MRHRVYKDILDKDIINLFKNKKKKKIKNKFIPPKGKEYLFGWFVCLSTIQFSWYHFTFLCDDRDHLLLHLITFFQAPLDINLDF